MQRQTQRLRDEAAEAAAAAEARAAEVAALEAQLATLRSAADASAGDLSVQLEVANNRAARLEAELEEASRALRAHEESGAAVPPAARARLDNLQEEVGGLQKELRGERSRTNDLERRLAEAEAARKKAAENAAAAEAARAAAEEERDTARVIAASRAPAPESPKGEAPPPRARP